MATDARKDYNNINIKNRRASFEYEFLDKYTAGIQLTGTEIKSIRESKASLEDAYCLFLNNELWVRNMHIAEYKLGTHFNHEPKRDRKLLLNKKELVKLKEKLKVKGLTIITTQLFINEKGLAKLNIVLAKGKKLHDKRDSIKERDTKREIDRVFKK
jgi:SsrA-binding protein